MNIKEINSKKLFKEYEVQVPYEEIDKSINAKIAKIIPTVTMPGFRRGKAPLNLVKKKYEGSVLNEVIEKIIENTTKELLDEKKLKAFRQPKVEIKKYTKDEPVEIAIKIDLEPSIKLFPFSELEINERSIKIDKKTFKENYKNFSNSQKHYHKVNSSKVVELSDRITVNISSNDLSVPDFLKSKKNLPIVTDSDYQILPDISKILIRKKAKVGDKINLKFDLKKILNEKNKKQVEFLIEIVSLEHCHEFEVSKEFLKKNNLKDEEDLKENINNNLTKQYEGYLKQIQKKELIDILDKKYDFEVSEGMLEEEFDEIWHKLENAKKENKLDEDDKSLSDSDLKKRYKIIALRRVKLAILMQHIANEEKITVSEKELTDGMLNYASQYPGQEKQIFDYFKQNPKSIESIRGPIFEQKIIDFILSKAKLKKESIDVSSFQKLQNQTFKGNEEI